MENASKALLIAGAILLVIAIIGIGMAIFNQAQGVIDRGGQQIDTLAVQAHNSMFDSYIDKVVKGKTVKDLCAKIASYNQQADVDYQVTIKLSVPGAGGAAATVTDLVTTTGLATTGEGAAAVSNVSKLTANKNYEVTGDMNPTTGVYTTITVTEHN